MTSPPSEPPASVETLIKNFLDDDRPTTPGDMRWVPCDCSTLGRFAPGREGEAAEQCEICGGHGYKLVTVEREI